MMVFFALHQSAFSKWQYSDCVTVFMFFVDVVQCLILMYYYIVYGIDAELVQVIPSCFIKKTKNAAVFSFRCSCVRTYTLSDCVGSRDF